MLFQKSERDSIQVKQFFIIECRFTVHLFLLTYHTTLTVLFDLFVVHFGAHLSLETVVVLID